MPDLAAADHAEAVTIAAPATARERPGAPTPPAALLSPARQALASHAAAVAAASATIEALTGPKRRLDAALALEGEATAELDDIARREAEAMNAWATTPDVIDMPEPQTAARRKCGEKLQRAKALAYAARSNLPDVEGAIAAAVQRQRDLIARTDDHVAAVMLEDAETVRLTIDAAVEIAREAMVKLAGLAEFFGRRSPQLRVAAQRVFPSLSLTQALLESSPGRELENSRLAWASLARSLESNPAASF